MHKPFDDWLYINNQFTLNCKTAVIHNGGWKDQRINAIYHEMAEHYGTAIIPARVRTPKDKPNAEGTVGNISTWIIAALRNEQFFTITELNMAIKEKLDEFNHRPFQKKEGSRYELFRDEELPLLAPLPATRYELAEWKQTTVQFKYHISVDGMLYSIPYEYIGKKVDVRVTGTVIEVFYNKNRIAPTDAYTVVRTSTASLRSICQRIISPISNGMATASVSGRRE